jgi:hypothetical protein
LAVLGDHPFPTVTGTPAAVQDLTGTPAVVQDLMDYGLPSRHSRDFFLNLDHMLTNYLHLVSR